MKKKYFILLSIITILLVNSIGCSKETSIEKQYKQIEKELGTSYVTQDYDNIIGITKEESLKKLQNNETFIIFFTRSDCKYCKNIYPALANILPNDLIIYSVNLDCYRLLGKDLDKESELFKYVDQEYDNYLNIWNIQGPPNIIYIKNGKIEKQKYDFLSKKFFDQNNSESDKQYYLNQMNIEITSYINDIYKDMNNIDGVSSEKITINKEGQNNEK